MKETVKTKEFDLRSAQAKERRRSTLDSASEAARARTDAESRARSADEARGSSRGRSGRSALHAVGDAPAGGKSTAREPGAPTGTDTASATAELHGGLMLRGARNGRGLSVADVAKQTRIADRWIIAIEEARLEDLPAPVFAIGYVRSYARAVGLDPSAIVEHFRVHGPQRDDSFWGSLPDRSGATPRSLEQAKERRKYLLWTATFMLVGLAVLVAVWLRSRH
ncbi:MAG TPA: helix-turn-helix domain-containing protein [Pseudomonadota bacterium]|nr:helix-turn-helix domain-containing protein [Pseudomonadota bacterium]